MALDGLGDGGGDIDRAFAIAERIVSTHDRMGDKAYALGRDRGRAEGRVEGYEEGFRAGLEMAARSIMAIVPGTLGSPTGGREAGAGDAGRAAADAVPVRGDAVAAPEDVRDEVAATAPGAGGHPPAGPAGEVVEARDDVVGEAAGACGGDATGGAVADVAAIEADAGDGGADVGSTDADGNAGADAGEAVDGVAGEAGDARPGDPLLFPPAEGEAGQAAGRRRRVTSRPQKGEPEVPLDPSPFPDLDYDALNKVELRVFNVVSVQPQSTMGVALIAKEAESTPPQVAAALRRLVALGHVVATKQGHYKPAEGKGALTRVKLAFLRNSDQIGTRTFQKRSMLYSIAVLGRARANAIARQGKTSMRSSDLYRGLTELVDQKRIVVDEQGYYGLAPGLYVQERQAPVDPDARTRTFAMVKCGAVERGDADAIVEAAQAGGLSVVAMRRLRLPAGVAEGIYGEHEGKPFFPGLIESVTSGDVVVMALEGPDAAHRWRELMGKTDPASAEPGTIRARFGRGLPDNATHGSDGAEAAERELALVAPLFTAEDQAV